MAYNTQISDAAANAAANAVAALANSGYLKFYTGSQPANANTALSGQTLLATLTFSATAFGNAAAGVATANAIGADTSADASGTATWFRVLKSDGTSVVFDGTVGTSGCNLNMNSNVISAGASVSGTALTYSILEAG
ncbi:MAG: hypothetical protein NTW28_25160, partial [Candidatus Solibacter sp.]|nr:hypothetical protein [Candidatus Solibacter sp.]